MFDSRLPHSRWGLAPPYPPHAELALWREHLLDKQDQAGSIPALRTPFTLSMWRNRHTQRSQKPCLRA